MKDSWVQVKFGNKLVNVRIRSEILRRFKVICETEGVSMSDKIRQWIILHIYDHEKGNPQLLLFPRKEKSILEEVIGEKVPLEFPMTRIRRERVFLLAKFFKDNPEMKRADVIHLFAGMYGHRVSTVRRYARLLHNIQRGDLLRKIEN